jgi:tetratricopeptide (TPR) repeat protein
MKTLHTQPKVLLKKLLTLEKSGRYEQALAEIKHFWKDADDLPEIDEFEPNDAAEIILRRGSLTGFLGHNNQIPDAQEKSKNLLSEARSKFLALKNIEKVAECENYIALAYWRAGELNEAEVFIVEALSHNLPNTNKTRLYSYIIESKVDFAKNRYKKICQNFDRLKIYFAECGDYFLKANYHNHLGLAQKNLDNLTDALPNIERAREYFYKIKHYNFGAACENNLSQIYKSQKNFAEAHQAIDGATKTFKKIKDLMRQGFSLDTKAQIYFAESKYAKALETVEDAIAILQKSKNVSYLTETLLTKVKILTYLDDFASALMCLTDAVQLAKNQISEEAAVNLIRKFELTLKEKPAAKPQKDTLEEKNGKEDLQLILPTSIAHYEDIQAIRIKNARLEDVGLKKDSLAVVAGEKLKRGDLAAICEIETDEVSCGFYDSEFGIVCLESNSGEPQLFDEEKIKILGKIVGVCSSETAADGKVTVELINI